MPSENEAIKAFREELKRLRRKQIQIGLRGHALKPIVAVIIASSLAVAFAISGSEASFPTAVGTALAALLTAEVFLVGFAQSAWRTDSEAFAAEIAEECDSLFKSFSVGPTRHPLYTYLDSVRHLSARVAEFKAASSGVTATLESVGADIALLKDAIEDPNGDAARLMELSSDRYDNVEPALEERGRHTIGERLALANGRFSIAIVLGAGVFALAVIGTSYIERDSLTIQNPSLWLPFALVLASIAVVISGWSVGRSQRRVILEHLDELTFPLLVVKDLEVPKNLKSDQEEATREYIRQLTMRTFKHYETLARHARENGGPRGKREANRLLRKGLRLAESRPNYPYWSDEQLDFMQQQLKLRPYFAPTRYLLGAFCLWEAGRTVGTTHSPVALDRAARLLEPLVRLRTGAESEYATRWVTDVDDPLVLFLRSGIASMRPEETASIPELLRRTNEATVYHHHIWPHPWSQPWMGVRPDEARLEVSDRRSDL